MYTSISITEVISVEEERSALGHFQTTRWFGGKVFKHFSFGGEDVHVCGCQMVVTSEKGRSVRARDGGGRRERER